MSKTICHAHGWQKTYKKQKNTKTHKKRQSRCPQWGWHFPIIWTCMELWAFDKFWTMKPKCHELPKTVNRRPLPLVTWSEAVVHFWTFQSAPASLEPIMIMLEPSLALSLQLLLQPSGRWLVDWPTKLVAHLLDGLRIGRPILQGPPSGSCIPVSDAGPCPLPSSASFHWTVDTPHELQAMEQWLGQAMPAMVGP